MSHNHSRFYPTKKKNKSMTKIHNLSIQQIQEKNIQISFIIHLSNGSHMCCWNLKRHTERAKSEKILQLDRKICMKQQILEENTHFTYVSQTPIKRHIV